MVQGQSLFQQLTITFRATFNCINRLLISPLLDQSICFYSYRPEFNLLVVEQPRLFRVTAFFFPRINPHPSSSVGRIIRVLPQKNGSE